MCFLKNISKNTLLYGIKSWGGKGEIDFSNKLPMNFMKEFRPWGIKTIICWTYYL